MIKKILIGISIFLVLLVIGVVIFYQISLGKVSNDDTEIFFEIESGMSISNIVSTLKEENLMFITNPGRMGDEDGSTFIIKEKAGIFLICNS